MLGELLDNTIDFFNIHFGHQPTFVAYAPGRINIIGEHTDYNQGLSMPTAINRWVTMSVSPTNDNSIHIYSLDYGSDMNFMLHENYAPKSSWEKYVYGCICIFDKASPLQNGFNAVIIGDVPIGSGVSSSAALEVAVMNALNKLVGSKLDGFELIKLCQQVEHQFLGVKSGLLDQYASQFSKENQYMILDFQNISHSYIAAEMHEYEWVLCDTKIQRSLAGSNYSKRVEETNEAIASLKNRFPEIVSFRDITLEQVSFLENEVHKKRIRHYVSENLRVAEAIEALAANDMVTLGNLLLESHNSLKDDYEVSCPELDFLVTEALIGDECIGSRMMGGGFGGCTLNLVQKNSVYDFLIRMSNRYYETFQIESEVNVYQSVDGAGVFVLESDV